ncbi:MAG: nucleotidyl transferase AbiEii/AbiGii toxin family protein [Aeriscardovia sp.]|nr:nucleotidyl transferase AbiEii/AbiGii toxin family protein [Aeriscardovia sp.]
MKAEQLTAKLRNISKQIEVSPQILLKIYMFDSLVERISISRYKDNFVLKGAFYLSTLFGLANRFTEDIDAMLQNAPFTEDNLNATLQEIFAIDTGDGALLRYRGIEPIRKEDKYGGFRVGVEGGLENIRDNFHIDIATGDEIIPHKSEYSYTPLLGGNDISIYAYSLETVLAEKLETLFRRSISNGRMKDYYDIYLIYQTNKDKINMDLPKEAVKTVFANRGLTVQHDRVLSLMEENGPVRTVWSNYSKKHPFAREIKFDDVFACVKNLCKEIGLTQG